MRTKPPVVALEIGTSKVVALVGEEREDGNIIITGMGEHPSTGIRKGEVVDLESASLCVKAALDAAEAQSEVAIREVFLSITGSHFQCSTNRGSVPVMDEDHEITDADVEEVIDIAKAVNLPADRDVLHALCQHFWIDNQTMAIRPEGMEGTKLGLDMLLIHGVRSRIHNTLRTVQNLEVDIEDVVLAGRCSAMAVVTEEQRTSGVVVIDIGGGTTDYFAYIEDVADVAGVIGVGGDHITNDIAAAFAISASRAEALKKEAGCAVIDPSCEGQRIQMPPEVGFQSQSIIVKSLHTVINARVDEMLRSVRRVLEESGSLARVGAGIILTGGTSHLPGICELAERIFGLPCYKGKPRGVSGLEAATEKPEYATGAGLLKYGFKTMDTSAVFAPSFPRIFKKLFGR